MKQDIIKLIRITLNESRNARRTILQSSYGEKISYKDFVSLYQTIMKQTSTIMEMIERITADGKYLLSEAIPDNYNNLMSEYAEFIRLFESQSFSYYRDDIFFCNCLEIILTKYQSLISSYEDEFNVSHHIAWDFAREDIDSTEMISISEFLGYFEQYIKSFFMEVYTQIGVEVLEVEQLQCVKTEDSKLRLKLKNSIDLKNLHSFLINAGYVATNTTLNVFKKIMTLDDSIGNKKSDKIVWLDVTPQTKQSNQLSLIKMADIIWEFRKGIKGRRVEKLNIIANHFTGVKNDKSINFELSKLSKPQVNRIDCSPSAIKLQNFILSHS